MRIIEYDAAATVRYAKKWAHRRNPAYYNFDELGGDCTAFASQCLLAGSGVMNYTPTLGWYYISLRDRAPAWSGVEYFYNFLINNFKGVGNETGPFGAPITADKVGLGDFIQLGNAQGKFYHTLVVTGFRHGEPLVSSHTVDSFDRLLSSYDYYASRTIKIVGVRTY